MKWTMITLAAAGLAAYALIFLTHVQSDDDAADSALAMATVGAEAPASADLQTPDPTAVEAAVATLPGSPVSKHQSSSPSPRWTGDAWTAGVKAYEARDYALAVDALEAAVSEKEQSAYRHYLLGLSYLKTDAPEASVEELRRSLELSPTFTRALVNLGRAQLLLEEPEAAREAVDLALEQDIDDGDAWNVLGRIELSEQHLEQADAAFAKAVDKSPDHAWAWNNLGYVRIIQGRFGDAVQPLRHATASGLQVACFWNNLGVALERADSLDQSAQAYARADSLGHDTAGASRERVETVLLARAQTPEAQVEPAAQLVAARADGGLADPPRQP